MTWYPLKLSYHVRTYAFGERLIPDRLGKRNLPDGVMAETWEVSDYRDTSGTILNGAFAGTSLHELTMAHPDELVGQGWRGPHFPLLEKFLDASHMLPVHLHADDETARRKYGEPNGKTEAWHILWTVPGASILAGIKPGMTEDDLIRAFKAQDYDRVIPKYEIKTGDTVFVPGGVLHAFGPDTLIFEVQQTSDLGQSVMPTDLYGNRLEEAVWDRNIQETLDELRTDYLPKPHPGLTIPSGRNRRVVGCVSPQFVLERWQLNEMYIEQNHPWRCTTLTNVGSRVQLEYEGSTEVLERAESCILPAAIGEVRVIPDGEADLIACFVPDLQRDVVIPLTNEGYAIEEIRALGNLNSH